MYNWQKNFIGEYLPFLIENIKCNVTLLCHLRQLNVLSVADEQLVNACQTPLAKSCHLLGILETRVHGYEHLAKSLYYCKQTEALYKLLEGLHGNVPENSFDFCGIQVDRVEVLSKIVIFEGAPLPLKTLLPPNGNEDILSKIIRTRTEDSIAFILHKDTNHIIAKSTIQSSTPHYINRSLSATNQLKKSFFNSLKPDIFLIEGMEKHQLTKLAQESTLSTFFEKLPFVRQNLTSSSGKQKNNLTCRFILLQMTEHFQEISQKTEHPVHWIRHHNGIFHFIKTNGKRPFHELKKYVGHIEDNFSQEELVFAWNHTQHVGLPVLMCGSPGMGKSFLLANIAKQVKIRWPERNVIYVEMQTFVSHFAKYGDLIDSHTLTEVLLDIVTVNELGRVIQSQVFERPNHQIELFLDSFDEVVLAKIAFAKRILQFVAQKVKSIHLYITSRMHRCAELESILGTLSYKLLPLNESQESQQISLFTNYWQTENRTSCDASSIDSMEVAKQCLLKIKSGSSCEKENVVGIPLQCKMLAETYAHAENHYGVADQVNPKFTYEMFKKYVETKLESNKNEKSYIELYRAHISLALATIFPEQFTCETGKRLYEPLCKIGIIEMSSSGSIRFIHRTYAEYFVAQNVLSYLFGNTVHVDDNKMIELIFSSILQETEKQAFIHYNGTNHRWYNFRTFKQTEIVYFLNFAISENHTGLKLLQVGKLVEKSIFYSGEILLGKLWCCLEKDLQHLVRVLLTVYVANFHNAAHDSNQCSPNNLCENINILTQSSMAQDIGSFGYWHDALMTAANFASLDLVEFFVVFYEKCGGGAVLNTNYPTPLHAALHRGNYHVAEYFISLYRNTLSQMNFILHECLYNSRDNTDAVINDKVQMIKLLIRIRPELLYKVDSICGIPPILTERAHVKLIKCLVDEGADFCKVAQVVAFKVATYFSADEYHDFVELLDSKNAQKALQQRDGEGNTPLHFALCFIDLKQETINLLYIRCDITFNTRNLNGNTELFSAIEGGRNKRVLNDLINVGADPRVRNRNGHNALCVALQNNNLPAFEYFLEKNVPVNKRCSRRSKNLFYHALLCREDVRGDAIRLLLQSSSVKINSIIIFFSTFELGIKSVCTCVTPYSFATMVGADGDIKQALKAAGGGRFNPKTIILNFFSICCELCFWIGFSIVFTPKFLYMYVAFSFCEFCFESLFSLDNIEDCVAMTTLGMQLFCFIGILISFVQLFEILTNENASVFDVILWMLILSFICTFGIYAAAFCNSRLETNSTVLETTLHQDGRNILSQNSNVRVPLCENSIEF